MVKWALLSITLWSSSVSIDTTNGLSQLQCTEMLKEIVINMYSSQASCVSADGDVIKCYAESEGFGIKSVPPPVCKLVKRGR